MSSQPPLSVHWGTAEGGEDISRYTLGGFHPVRLGDVYKSDTSTYRVLHKLGRGAFATVWLARTLHQATPSYVAIKICAADVDPRHELGVHDQLRAAGLGQERHVIQLLDSFSLNGPNGTHVVLVHDALGNLRDLALPRKEVRKLCRQIVQGVAFLHARGIAHGDLHYGNIGFCLPKLYEHSEEDILDYFGHPEVSLVLPHKPPLRPESLPPYIVESIALGDYYKAKTPSFTDSAICAEIIDLGSAMVSGQPPRPSCTPAAVCAPEIMFKRVTTSVDSPATLESDIWSLACTLYEIVYGSPLFHWASPNNALLQKMANLCGEMPLEWMLHLQHDSTISVESEWQRRPDTAFVALLRSMMKMDPRARPTAEEVLCHPWFSQVEAE